MPIKVGILSILSPFSFRVLFSWRKEVHENVKGFSRAALAIWEVAKKVQLALIESQPRAFQRAIDKKCTLPLSPLTGGTKRDFALFFQ